MAKITYVISGLTNDVTYYGKVYSVNPKDRVNNRADLTVFAAKPRSFPTSPSTYVDLISTYRYSGATQVFTAPESGYFRIMAFGSSGAGSAATCTYNDLVGTNYSYKGDSGNGGGGGAYSCSDVKLFEGDTITMSLGAASGTTTITINSTTGETYSTMTLVGGKPGSGTRAGGTASGGNVANANGGAGGTGESGSVTNDDLYLDGGAGGKAGHSEGNAGGAGGDVSASYAQSGGSGKSAFVRIYRGNTNVLV